MTFERRILHHGSDPAGTPQLLSLTTLRSCWFQLQRQGGCGAGELVLGDDFEQRNLIEVGDWISLEAMAGVRWYLGRVEERRAEVPACIRLRLEGMSVELNQVFPGGFGPEGRPHRYGAADRFSADPDRDLETADLVGTAEDVVHKLMTQYVGSSGNIQYDPALIETPNFVSPVVSLKLRGEESVRSILKDLALRAQSASWGVDAYGKFFFLRPRNALLATYREQQDLVSLSETRDVEYLFNRLLLTGDYVYDRQLEIDDVARRAYRWRGNYFEPSSRGQYGDRRLKVWLPWIRTQEDSLAFAKEFFRAYAQPVSRYLMETTPQTLLPFPWMGRIALESVSGTELARARIETIRVLFDQVPRFRLELGPEDPRELWPEPPQDERWELPNQRVSMGGPVSGPPPLSSDGGGGGSTGAGGDSSLMISSSDDFSSEEDSSSAGSSDASEDSEASSNISTASGSWVTPVFTSGGPPLPSFDSSSTPQTSADDSDHSSPDDSDDVTETSVPLTSYVWSPTFPSTGAWDTHDDPGSEDDSSSGDSSSDDDESTTMLS